jgi:hypothetical protein
VESRVSCCRRPVWARAFRGRPPEAGTARHPSGPACRQVVQLAARWWSPPEQSCRNAARWSASGRNWRRGQAMAARFGPGVSKGQGVPVHSPHWWPPSTHMKARMRVSYPWGENGLRSRWFRKTRTERSIFRRDGEQGIPPIRLLSHCSGCLWRIQPVVNSGRGFGRVSRITGQ